MRANDLNVQNNVISLLGQKYGIKAKETIFIPVGEESFAYKVVADNGQAFFVKYCQKANITDNLKTINELLLQIKDLNFIIPPVVCDSQTSFDLGPGKIYLFPFVEGEILKQGNETFDKNIVAELTKIVVQIHNLKDSVKVLLPVESFSDNYLEQLEKLKFKIQRGDNALKSLFETNEPLVRSILEKQELEAQKYREQKPDFVLTHGDVTGRNIIQADDGLKLVDWDGAMFAPAEKDLIFLYDNPNFSLDDYYRQIGKNKSIFDHNLMEYYRRQWAIETILGNFEMLLTEIPDQNRQDYLNELNEYLNLYR